MSANIETMFYVRKAPWHGLGTKVNEAPTSKEALEVAGLDWSVNQSSIFTNDDILIPNYKANIRDIDEQILGVVTDRYKVVQNEEAFAFTDSLLGEGVTYETAGSLQGGKKVWLLAKLPEKFKLLDDEVSPYLVFFNSHDGSGAIKVAMTPVRVVCQNTLNLALNTTKRIWTTNHTGNIEAKLLEANRILSLANEYMSALGSKAFSLSKVKLDDKRVLEFINDLLPITDKATTTQITNIKTLRDDFKYRYFNAPDLTQMPKNAWRFINATSDFATHVTPLRKTKNYNSNLFLKATEGNPIIDKAYNLIKAIA